MKTVKTLAWLSVLAAVAQAALIPSESLKQIAHPKYKPNIYAQFGDHDIDCGHVSLYEIRSCSGKEGEVNLG